jgi:hypothetical protein
MTTEEIMKINPPTIRIKLHLLDFEKAVDKILDTILRYKKNKHKQTAKNSVRILYQMDRIGDDGIPLTLSNIFHKFNFKYGPYRNPKDKVRNYLDILVKGELAERTGRLYQLNNKIIYGTTNPEDHLRMVLEKIDKLFDGKLGRT